MNTTTRRLLFTAFMILMLFVISPAGVLIWLAAAFLTLCNWVSGDDSNYTNP